MHIRFTQCKPHEAIQALEITSDHRTFNWRSHVYLCVTHTVGCFIS